MYLVYSLILYLLWVIDIAVLMYYLFWINNIFINPLLWLCVKILFYNKTIILLLLFYYYIAKFTISQPGYKYFRFFGIDVKKWRKFYLSFLWDITTYHIEIISIFIFFIVITIPLYLHHKEYYILIFSIIVYFLIFLKIMKNRILYIKEKKTKLVDLFFVWFLIVLVIKTIGHDYFKDVLTYYIHLDKWAFELLEWKIKTYDKLTEKDLYSEMLA